VFRRLILAVLLLLTMSLGGVTTGCGIFDPEGSCIEKGRSCWEDRSGCCFGLRCDKGSFGSLGWECVDSQ